MKLEALKSIVLSALILLSILFTISIWNYQPSYESLSAPEFTDPQLNGEEVTKREMIDPREIIFHMDEEYLRLQDISAEETFYSAIQELVLFDFEPVSEGIEEIDGEKVELLFPLALSGKTLSDLFIIEEEDIPTAGFFDKIVISLENESELSEVQFIDTENNQQFVAHIRQVDVKEIVEEFDEEESFVEQIVFYGKNDHPIYLPAEQPELYIRYFSVNLFSDTSELDPLVKVLFSDPTVVKQNPINGGVQYTDARREIKAYSNYMEFIDPLVEYKEMDKWGLIDQSLAFVNDHHGWTTGGRDEYQLEKVNTNNNTVTYRLYYDGYPVIDRYGHLTTIQLTIHDQLVYKYSRPLFQLLDQFTLQEENVEIGSGAYALSLLEENEMISAEEVENISIGYKLSAHETNVQLIPVWYYKDKAGWKEIPVPETTEEGEA